MEVVEFLQEGNGWILAAIALASFLGSLVLVPWLLVSLPADYFHHSRRHAIISERATIPRLLLMVLKNLLGMVIILMGILMLVLPGQGVLTILIGLVLLDFPGKYRCERWLVSRRRVLRSVNWLRARYDKPAFLVDPNPE